MNCNDFTQWLDDYLDRELEPGQHAAMATHQQVCDRCRQRSEDEQGLRAALRHLPAPEPAEAFLEQALQRVTRPQRRRRSGRIGLALAASLILGISVTTLLDNAGHPAGSSARPPVMQIALNEKRDVKLVFDSATALDAAQLTLVLPAQVRVAGYPDRQRLSWVTRLKQGKNLLVLPVAAREFGHGRLVARIEHDGATKTFAVDLDVTEQQQSVRTLTGAQTV
jgi:anti-sigma factor RsiW